MVKLDNKIINEIDKDMQAAEDAVMDIWAKKLNTSREEIILAYMQFQLKRMQADREMEMAQLGRTITPDFTEYLTPKKIEEDKDKKYKS